MKKFFTLIFISFFTGLFGQSVSDYQCVIVPRKFDFLRSENQYQVNGLTKFLFEKYNFTAYWSDDIPAQVTVNMCDALKANVHNKSNMFVTRVFVTLTDCTGKVIFTSKEGKSREKEYAKAYNEALREAFEDVEVLNYKYAGAKPKTPDTTPKISQQEVTTTHNDTYPLLYAQPIDNGYQLIDKTPQIVLKLQKTSLPAIYNASNSQNVNGIFYAQDNYYVFEFTEGGKQQKIFYNVNQKLD